MARGKVEQGVVKSFDPERGIGEVETARGEVLSVHRSSLRDDALKGVYPGDIVEFVSGRDRFGRRAALEIRRIGWEDEEDENAAPREWTF